MPEPTDVERESRRSFHEGWAAGELAEKARTRAAVVKALRDAAYTARGMRPTTPELWSWWLDARADVIENGADFF